VKRNLAIPNLIESWRRANIAALEIRKTDEILAARAAAPSGGAAKMKETRRP
jgi:hypothetical protein